MARPLFPSRQFDRSLVILALYGGLGIVAWLGSRVMGRENLFIYGPVSSSYRFGHVCSSLLLGVAFGLFIVLLTRIFQERSIAVKQLHHEFHHVLSSLTARDIFLLAAMSAIGEECFFRSTLFFFLQSRHAGVWGVMVAILGSSFLFSLIHIGPSKRFLSWTVSSFLMGLFLALIFVWVGDLFAPIAAHFVINWLNARDIVKRPSVF